MELKRVLCSPRWCGIRLLIVPYGIETRVHVTCCYSSVLLIVPYGIETRYAGRILLSGRLLIVPYGIETIF